MSFGGRQITGLDTAIAAQVLLKSFSGPASTKPIFLFSLLIPIPIRILLPAITVPRKTTTPSSILKSILASQLVSTFYFPSDLSFRFTFFLSYFYLLPLSNPSFSVSENDFLNIRKNSIIQKTIRIIYENLQEYTFKGSIYSVLCFPNSYGYNRVRMFQVIRFYITECYIFYCFFPNTFFCTSFFGSISSKKDSISYSFMFSEQALKSIFYSFFIGYIGQFLSTTYRFFNDDYGF